MHAVAVSCIMKAQSIGLIVILEKNYILKNIYKTNGKLINSRLAAV